MERAGVLAGLVVLASGAIAGAVLGGNGLWMHWLCKPLATMLLICWLSGGGAGQVDRRYRRWVLGGLFFSLLGDVLLMLPFGLFVPGLLAFLLAHLCYITAFIPGAARQGLLLGGAVGGVLAVGNLSLLWPHLPADMQLPVTAYVLVIGLMAALAVSRAWTGLRGGRLAASGALLFVASDTWLAWDRFAGPLPWAIAGVLLTYWSAQFVIAASAVSAAATSGALASEGVLAQ